MRDLINLFEALPPTRKELVLFTNKTEVVLAEYSNEKIYHLQPRNKLDLVVNTRNYAIKENEWPMFNKMMEIIEKFKDKGSKRNIPTLDSIAEMLL